MIGKILRVLVPVLAFVGGAAAGDMLRGGGDQAVAAAAGHDNAAAAGASSDGHDPADAPPSPDHAAPEAEPAHEPPAQKAAGHAAPAASGHGGGAEGADDATAWFKFPQQFFVPILQDGRLDSTMVLSLTIEMPGASTETVFAHEHKLRDALLRQLLIHANTGGFDGNFTADAHLRALREALLGAAQNVVPDVSEVLIGDIARQER